MGRVTNAMIKEFLKSRNWVAAMHEIQYDGDTHSYSLGGQSYLGVTSLLRTVEGEDSFESNKQEAAGFSANHFLTALKNANTFEGLYDYQVILNNASQFVYSTLRRLGIINEHEILVPRHTILYLLKLSTIKGHKYDYDQLLCFMLDSTIYLQGQVTEVFVDGNFYYLCTNGIHKVHSEFNNYFDPENPGVIEGEQRKQREGDLVVMKDFGSGDVLLDSGKYQRKNLEKPTATGIPSKGPYETNWYNVKQFLLVYWKTQAHLGTLLHEKMEIFANLLAQNSGVDVAIRIEDESSYLKKKFKEYLDNNKDLEIWATEVPVASQKRGVAGRIDCVLKVKNTNIFEIIDFKRVKEVCDSYKSKKERQDHTGEWFFYFYNKQYHVCKQLTETKYVNYKKGKEIEVDIENKDLKPFGSRKIDKYFNQLGLYKNLLCETVGNGATVRRVHIFAIRPYGRTERFSQYTCPGYYDATDMDYVGQPTWYKTFDMIDSRANAVLENNGYIPIEKKNVNVPV